MHGVSNACWLMAVYVGAARFFASPGEFPFVAVISSKNGSLHSGIIITRSSVMSDWSTIAPYLTVLQEPIWAYPSTDFIIVASNGDWRNDRKTQTRESTAVCKHQRYRIVNEIPINNVAVIFIDDPFSVTPYVVPVTERTGSPEQSALEQSVWNSSRTPSRAEVFVIGGLACSDGRFEARSPMFRQVTEMVPWKQCETAICGNKCQGLDREEQPLCFEHDGVGGAGSPVLKDWRIVGIGSLIKKGHNRSYLVVTPFQIGVKMMESVLSGGSRISTELTVFIAIWAVNGRRNGYFS